MDWIEPKNGKRHALISADRRGENGHGRTWCGKELTGQTGVGIAALIECKTCRTTMRKEGWTV